MAWVLLFMGGWWVYRCKDPSLRKILIVAYVLRAGLALEHHFGFPLPDSQADAITFLKTATLWSHKGVPYLLTHVRTNAWLYVWGLSWVFLFFGPDPFLAQMINVLLGVGAVKLVYRISYLLWDSRKAYRAAWIAALLPSLMLYSALPMRESLLVFTFLLGIAGWLKWYLQGGRGWLALGQSLIGFMLSAGLHTAMVPGLALPFFAFSSLMFSQLKRYRLSITTLFIGGLMGLVVAGTLATGWGMDYLIGAFHSASLLAWLQHHLMSAARSRAAYLQGVLPCSWWDVVWMTPMRMLYFLFAPFPWMVSQVKDLLGVLNSAMWCVLLLWLIKKGKRIWKRPSTRFLLWTFLGVWITLSWGVSNYGTAIRHGVKLLPLIVVLLPFPKVRFFPYQHQDG